VLWRSERHLGYLNYGKLLEDTMSCSFKSIESFGSDITCKGFRCWVCHFWVCACGHRFGEGVGYVPVCVCEHHNMAL
jgi:hypothetical protein